MPSPGVEKGTYSSLSFFQHEPESYQFTAGFYVDREALLTRKDAELVVRPGLSVNGTPVSLKLLEEVKLTIHSTDHDGILSSVDLPDFKLFEDRESTHEFQVPQRLATLSFELTAKIRQFTTGSQISVAAGDSFSLNGIDKTEKVEDLHLLKADGGYVVELRGRTGEPKISRPVQFQIKHDDFREPVGAVLKTDPQGRISLGTLAEIASVTASGTGRHVENLEPRYRSPHLLRVGTCPPRRPDCAALSGTSDRRRPVERSRPGRDLAARTAWRHLQHRPL